MKVINKAESEVTLCQVLYYLTNVLHNDRFNIYNTDDGKYIIEGLWMKETITILQSNGNNLVGRYIFKRNNKKEVIEMLEGMGFEVIDKSSPNF